MGGGGGVGLAPTPSPLTYTHTIGTHDMKLALLTIWVGIYMVVFIEIAHAL